MLIILLTEKIETNLIAPKFKVNDRVRIAEYKNIYTENCSREIFIIDFVLKTKKIGSFYEKKIVVEYIMNELLSRIRQSY